MPILGLLIIFFCIGSYILKYGDRFSGKSQKIKGFGLDLEISVRAIFILTGILLLFTGVYINNKDYESSLKEANATIHAAKIALEIANKKEVRIVVRIDGVRGGNMPPLDELKCKYFVPGNDIAIYADVVHGISPGTFKIILKEIASDTHISKLELEDKLNNRKWIKENFMPMEPVYTLANISHD